MNIHTYIPYAPIHDKLNLGKAYNSFMSMVDDEDWVLFMDHDATFTTKQWYNQVHSIIKNNPDYGLFTCLTNRIGSPLQRVKNIDYNNHDIRYHRSIGKNLFEKHKYEVEPWKTENEFLSGVVILVSKKTWNTINGVPDGFLGVDNCIHIDCIKNSIKVGIMKGLYVYHWYRGNNEVVEGYSKNPFYDLEYKKKRDEIKS